MVELTANLSTEDNRLALTDEFEYDKIRLVTIAQINFDAVWKRRKEPDEDAQDFKGTFQQAYPELECAKQDCQTVVDYFTREYDVESNDIQVLEDASLDQLKDAYEDLRDELKTNKTQRTLVIHVMSGHALHNQATGEASLFVNEWDQKTQHYRRFHGERMVKELADSCPNSYHIGLFIYCRGFEKAVEEKRFFSKAEVMDAFESNDLGKYTELPEKQPAETPSGPRDENGNYVLIHGAAPGSGIPFDTAMAKDFCLTFTLNRNAKREVMIPEVFDSITSNDEFNTQKCKDIKKVRLQDPNVLKVAQLELANKRLELMQLEFQKAKGPGATGDTCCILF